MNRKLWWRSNKLIGIVLQVGIVVNNPISLFLHNLLFVHFNISLAYE